MCGFIHLEPTKGGLNMARGRPNKNNEDKLVILHQKFWIWDEVFEEPREVEIVRRQVNERNEFLCWDALEFKARGSNGKRFCHQIFSTNQLFSTKKALCQHYIEMFERFINKED